MEIVIPVWLGTADRIAERKRINAIGGAQLAMVDDNYDAPFTERLEHVLREQFGAVVNMFVKPLGSAPSPKSLIDEAAGSDVAVVGIGL